MLQLPAPQQPEPQPPQPPQPQRKPPVLQFDASDDPLTDPRASATPSDPRAPSGSADRLSLSYAASDSSLACSSDSEASERAPSAAAVRRGRCAAREEAVGVPGLRASATMVRGAGCRAPVIVWVSSVAEGCPDTHTLATLHGVSVLELPVPSNVQAVLSAVDFLAATGESSESGTILLAYGADACATVIAASEKTTVGGVVLWGSPDHVTAPADTSTRFLVLTGVDDTRELSGLIDSVASGATTPRPKSLTLDAPFSLSSTTTPASLLRESAGTSPFLSDSSANKRAKRRTPDPRQVLEVWLRRRGRESLTKSLSEAGVASVADLAVALRSEGSPYLSADDCAAVASEAEAATRLLSVPWRQLKEDHSRVVSRKLRRAARAYRPGWAIVLPSVSASSSKRSSKRKSSIRTLKERAMNLRTPPGDDQGSDGRKSSFKRKVNTVAGPDDDSKRRGSIAAFLDMFRNRSPSSASSTAPRTVADATRESKRKAPHRVSASDAAPAFAVAAMASPKLEASSPTSRHRGHRRKRSSYDKDKTVEKRTADEELAKSGAGCRATVIGKITPVQPALPAELGSRAEQPAQAAQATEQVQQAAADAKETQLTQRSPRGQRPFTVMLGQMPLMRDMGEAEGSDVLRRKASDPTAHETPRSHSLFWQQGQPHDGFQAGRRPSLSRTQSDMRLATERDARDPAREVEEAKSKLSKSSEHASSSSNSSGIGSLLRFFQRKSKGKGPEKQDGQSQ
eukprot:m51a1_g6374 hypothetical protein (741) ;mRNA; r:134492-136951